MKLARIKKYTCGFPTSLLLASYTLLSASSSYAELLNTTKASNSFDGMPTNFGSYSASVSRDGSLVAYQSQADNLVNNDHNGEEDIFVYDVVNNQTERVSISNSGNEAIGGRSDLGEISAEGGHVVFLSYASNLVSNDTNGLADIFVRDRVNNSTERVNLRPGGAESMFEAREPDISGDGRFVVYVSDDDQLVANDNNGFQDVFVYDRHERTTQRINVSNTGEQANMPSFDPRISEDGSAVIFTSPASNLVPGDNNGFDDIFIYDLASSQIQRVNVNSQNIEAMNGPSFGAELSADGRFVVFTSNADNLVSNDNNGHDDIFIRDTQESTTSRVNVSSSGQQANSHSEAPSVSSNGRYVSFMSRASNLVNNDNNGFEDIFVHDRETSTTEKISELSNGAETDLPSFSPVISSNALYLVYESDSDMLVAGDNNGWSDIFVAQLDHQESGGNKIVLVPSSVNIDPLGDNSFSVDINVNASDLYGLEISCQTDANLASLYHSEYANLFDITSRLEITPQMNTPNQGDWSGSLSMMNPAPAINGSGTFATLYFTTHILESANFDISCTANAADINGQRIIMGLEDTRVVIDDGIHIPGGTRLSGNVSLPAGSEPSAILVTLTLGERSISTYADANGDYHFDSLRPGNWVVTYSNETFVSNCSVSQTTEGSDSTVADVVMYAGDVNSDGHIDIADFTVVSSLYGINDNDPNYLAAADLNRDGLINIFDLTILGSHFGLIACDPASVDPTPAPTLTFNNVIATQGVAGINTEGDVLSWQRNAASLGDYAEAIISISPEDTTQFALGLEASGDETSYFIELRNPALGNHIHLFYESSSPGGNLHVGSMIDGIPNHEDYVSSTPLSLMEFGFNQGQLTTTLNSQQYSPAVNAAGLGGNPEDWELMVRIEQSPTSAPTGTSSARLISSADMGLSLASSTWSINTP
ncbi:dockerin type I domain-containing protein [Agaribacterium sp. ZY112]|uniref:dockerin type I domain-containing protein n=1 Tax=Agaribacterium sp. ZY112 TaxID=3233574 RepID=UPI003525615C